VGCRVYKKSHKEGHGPPFCLRSFQLIRIVLLATMNMSERIRQEIGQSSISMFNTEVRSFTMSDQNFLTAGQFHNMCMRVPSEPQPCHGLLSLGLKGLYHKFDVKSLLCFDINCSSSHSQLPISLFLLYAHCKGYRALYPM
uniref:Uncharacterized protein n=1 Tax=Myripristis murdjan TaxID=586833 RepID=A0A667WIY9_9TELE